MCVGNSWIGGTPLLDGRDILAGGQSPAGNQQPEGGGQLHASVQRSELVQLRTDSQVSGERTSHKLEVMVESKWQPGSRPRPEILVDVSTVSWMQL